MGVLVFATHNMVFPMDPLDEKWIRLLWHNGYPVFSPATVVSLSHHASKMFSGGSACRPTLVGDTNDLQSFCRTRYHQQPNSYVQADLAECSSNLVPGPPMNDSQKDDARRVVELSSARRSSDDDGRRDEVHNYPQDCRHLDDLHRLQASFHYLSVQHGIPHHVDIATFAVRAKSQKEQEALCLDLLELLRSCSDAIPGPNPHLPLEVQPQWDPSEDDEELKKLDPPRRE